MIIKIWLRREPGTRKRTVRTDFKAESNDDPVISAYGRRLIAAIESGGDSEDETKSGKGNE